MKKNREIKYAVCIIDSEPDLVFRKVYEVLLDKSAAKNDYVRIIDESGEDYLYPSTYFVFIELPQEAERALSRAS